MTDKKQKTGRPPKNIVEPIKDTPERVAAAIMQSEPKKKWKYKKKD